jgi:hypothetical protein
MKLAKGPKVEKKPPIAKKVPKPVEKPKSREERMKENYSKLKYEIRSIGHKAGQLHDSCLKDKDRIVAVLDINEIEKIRLKNVTTEIERI